MADLGWQELMIILVIVMIVFGAGKLPEIAKALGQGVKEFRAEAQAPPISATNSSLQATQNAAPPDAAASQEAAPAPRTNALRPETI
jgi:sec-independent protein translocase protein TatA